MATEAPMDEAGAVWRKLENDARNFMTAVAVLDREGSPLALTAEGLLVANAMLARETAKTYLEAGACLAQLISIGADHWRVVQEATESGADDEAKKAARQSADRLRDAAQRARNALERLQA